LFKRRKKQIYDLSIAPQTTPQKPWTSDLYHPNLTHIVPMFPKKTGFGLPQEVVKHHDEANHV